MARMISPAVSRILIQCTDLEIQLERGRSWLGRNFRFDMGILALSYEKIEGSVGCRHHVLIHCRFFRVSVGSWDTPGYTWCEMKIGYEFLMECYDESVDVVSRRPVVEAGHRDVL